LDNIFHGLDELTSNFARLHEEMGCLDESECDEHANDTEDPVVVLLAAATVQRSALDWKCKLLQAPSAWAATSSISTQVKYAWHPLLRSLMKLLPLATRWTLTSQSYREKDKLPSIN